MARTAAKAPPSVKERAAGTQVQAANLETSAAPLATRTATAEARAQKQGHASMGGGLAPHVFPIHKAARAVLKVRRGWQTQDALAASGIPLATWYAWLNIPDGSWPSGEQPSPAAQRFGARLRSAFARAQALAAGKATESVFGASKMAVGERDWRAGHEWLKHGATRARWHEHRELKIEHGGKVDHEHRLAASLTDQELLELAPAEWRELVD